MLTAGGRAFGQRVAAVVRLEPDVFREIGRDVDATGQALAVVALAAIANGIGHGNEGLDGALLAVVSAVVGWVAFSIFAWLVGSAFAPGSGATLGRVFRLIGFAQAPKLIGALAFLPLVGWLFGLAGALLFLVVAVAALRSAFGVGLPRALLIGLVALVASEFVLWVLRVALHLGGAVLGAFGALFGRLFGLGG